MITRWAHLHRTEAASQKNKTLAVTAEFRLPDNDLCLDQNNLGLSSDSKETMRLFLKDRLYVDLTFLSRDFAGTESNCLQEPKPIGDHPFQLLNSMDDKYHTEFTKRLYREAN